MANRNVKCFFDRYSADFNAIYGNENSTINNLINVIFRKSMKIRYDRTISGCLPIKNKKVVDIGCGPGHYGITLAEMGAEYVCGVDFSEEMINIAKENSKKFGVEHICKFMCEDFLSFSEECKFDYSIAMGVMDYVQEPEQFIEKMISITNRKVFLSFPVDGGVLAWQRKLRYKSKCDLFMYGIERIEKLFAVIGCKKVRIEKVSRDFFVTICLEEA